MDKVLALLGLVVALATFAGAFDNWISLGLDGKLAFVFAANAAALYLLTRWFVEGMAPVFMEPRRRPAFFALFWRSLSLAAVVLVFAVIAILLADRFSLRISEAPAGNALATLLTAPANAIESIDIDLPPNRESDCQFLNRSLGPIPALLGQTISLATPTPRYHIDNFVRPQRVEIVCTPGQSLRGGVHTSAKVDVFDTDEMRKLRLEIVITGAVLWFVACFFLWR